VISTDQLQSEKDGRDNPRHCRLSGSGSAGEYKVTDRRRVVIFPLGERVGGLQLLQLLLDWSHSEKVAERFKGIGVVAGIVRHSTAAHSRCHEAIDCRAHVSHGKSFCAVVVGRRLSLEYPICPGLHGHLPGFLNIPRVAPALQGQHFLEAAL